MLLRHSWNVNLHDKKSHPTRLIYQFKDLNLNELNYHLMNADLNEVINVVERYCPRSYQ